MPLSPSRHLPLSRRLTYGVGHVLNDLCASMWFSYLLLYFHSVISFSNKMAGNLMLIGQVSDAICTPFIGLESDRTRGFCGYGKRKSWHLIGTISVMLTFTFLFMECIECEDSQDWAKFIYYIPFVVIFQFGWASTQISHLSLIPELTSDESERVELNAIRYAFTVISNILVYAIAWLLLNLKVNDQAVSKNLGPSDAPRFRDLAFVVVGIGAVFSFVFHFGTREKPGGVTRSSSEEKCEERDSLLETVARQDTNSFKRVPIMTWIEWVKEPQFYMVGLLYMCTRLVVNLSQVYIPMYLDDTLALHKQYIAIVPLVSYLFGFLTSLLMRKVNKIAGRKMTYCCGTLAVIGACVWFHFIEKDTEYTEIFTIVSAAILGAGTSTILVTSLSMTADLIGENTESGAFVYGAMSFGDKLSNGAAVCIIQQFHPCLTAACCPACESFYRTIMSLIPGGFACLALLVLLVLHLLYMATGRTVGERHYSKKPVTDIDENASVNPDNNSPYQNTQNNYGACNGPDSSNSPSGEKELKTCKEESKTGEDLNTNENKNFISNAQSAHSKSIPRESTCDSSGEGPNVQKSPATPDDVKFRIGATPSSYEAPI